MVLMRLLLVILATLSFEAVAAVLPPVGSTIADEEFAKLTSLYQQKQQKLERLGAKLKAPVYLNRLITANSPYLLRHATNPIDWHPWTQTVFDMAKAQNKPIFLSIGYSTCHWCHVMEQDSFVKDDVAALVNAGFIAIKVDREVHPAVDELYTIALTQVTGSAGWPITAILNPQGEPLFIDAFVPREKLKVLLSRISKIWQTNPAFLNQNAAQLMKLVNRQQSTVQNVDWTSQALQQSKAKLMPLLDTKHGGFAGAPKFPSEAMLLYTLDSIIREDSQQLHDLARLHLDTMANRGLYDHIHGGFHRYVTDDKWLIPHYEKMLYNQGQLMLAYSKAYMMFNDDDYKALLQDIFEFIKTWLYQPGAGLYSAIDADFEGEEGKFYLYPAKVLQNIDDSLKQQSGFQTYHFEKTGLKGLYFNRPNSAAAEKIRISLAQYHSKKPHIDRKIITGWNALVIWGLAQSYQATGTDQFKQLALELGKTLWAKHFHNGTLYRTSFHGTLAGKGTLEDYAYLARALVALYDLDGNQDWLTRAELLTAQAVEQFFDEKQGFVLTQDSGVQLKLNKTRDGEMLPASVVMVEVLDLLFQRTAKVSYRKLKRQAGNAIKQQIINEPLNHLYSAKAIAQIDENYYAQTQFFANGLGKISLESSSNCSAKLNIELQSGWHINSQKPLQDYLKPTKVWFEDDKGQVEYPKAHVTQLGFQKQPLSLFEGQFTLKVKSTHPRIKVDLQACSDKVCLLPQQLNFYLGTCN